MKRNDVIFILACMLVYAFAVMIIPPFSPLLELDSPGYLGFSPQRSALYPAFLRICIMLGFDLVQITWVQLAIFTAALGYLLATLLRAGFPKLLVGLFVIALAANVLFSSVHRSIMSDSIYFSMSIVAVALWIDYFRTGRVVFLGLAGLVLGLMIGIRPIGICLIPLHALAAWIKWPKRNVPVAAFVAALAVPVVLGIGSERLIYRAVHGDRSESLVPHLMTGKAAMLVRPNTVYTGPHAAALNALGGQLNSIYEPARQNLANAPSLSVRVFLSNNYEIMAQFVVLKSELEAAAEREGVSVNELRSELGKQAISQNIPGYLKLTLINDLGQWSVASARFPPTARALIQYIDRNPAIDLGGRIPMEILYPTSSVVGLIIYPAFLAAGIVTLLLSAGLIVFLVRPALADGPNGFYLVLAVFFSGLCHIYTLFIAAVNVAQPRFLMAVFPVLGIIAMCLVVFFLRQRRISNAGLLA